MTTISALLVVKDGAARLARALASVREQTRPADEILVVTAQGDDACAAIAREAGARVIAQTGQGLGDARNTAIARAAGTLIAFLDHDDLWPRDKLARQAAMLAPASAGYATGMIRRFDDHDGAMPTIGDLSAPFAARTPGVLLAARAFCARVGPFDTTLTMACDLDWFIRAGEVAPPVALPHVVLWKANRAGSLSADPARNRRETFAVLGRAVNRRRAL